MVANAEWTAVRSLPANEDGPGRRGHRTREIAIGRSPGFETPRSSTLKPEAGQSPRSGHRAGRMSGGARRGEMSSSLAAGWNPPCRHASVRRDRLRQIIRRTAIDEFWGPITSRRTGRACCTPRGGKHIKVGFSIWSRDQRLFGGPSAPAGLSRRSPAHAWRHPADGKTILSGRY